MNSVFDDPLQKQQSLEVDRMLREIVSELVKLRIKKRWSQQKVARRAGTTQNRVGCIETGADMKLTTFIRLCMALNREPSIVLKYWRDPALSPITNDEKVMMERGEIDDDLKRVELSDYKVRKFKKLGIIY